MVGVDRAHEHELGAIELEGRGCARPGRSTMLVPSMKLAFFSWFHPLLVCILALSRISMPSGTGMGFSKALVVLKTPTSEIWATLPSRVLRSILMALAVTFEPRTRRLAPTVPPLPYSTHWPPASRYETAKFLMCWPFWDGLLKGDHVEGALLGKLDEERLGARGVLGAPVGLVLAVEHLAGAVRGVVLPGAAGLGGSPPYAPRPRA